MGACPLNAITSIRVELSSDGDAVFGKEILHKTEMQGGSVPDDSEAVLGKVICSDN